MRLAGARLRYSVNDRSLPDKHRSPVASWVTHADTYTGHCTSLPKVISRSGNGRKLDFATDGDRRLMSAFHLKIWATRFPPLIFGNLQLPKQSGLARQ